MQNYLYLPFSNNRNMKYYFIVLLALSMLISNTGFSRSLRGYVSAVGANYGVLTLGPSLSVYKVGKADTKISYVESYWHHLIGHNFAYNVSALYTLPTKGTIEQLDYTSSGLGAAVGATAFTADLKRTGLYFFSSAQFYLILNTVKLSGIIDDPNNTGTTKDVSSSIKVFSPGIDFSFGADWILANWLALRAQTGFLASPKKNNFDSNEDLKLTLSLQGFHASAGVQIIF